MAANRGIMWAPADVEASGADDNIDLVLHAICRPDALGGDLLDARRDDGDVFLAQRLEISIAWCWPPAAHRKVFGHNQVGDLWLASEFGSHVFLRELKLASQQVFLEQRGASG